MSLLGHGLEGAGAAGSGSGGAVTSPWLPGSSAARAMSAQTPTASAPAGSSRTSGAPLPPQPPGHRVGGFEGSDGWAEQAWWRSLTAHGKEHSYSVHEFARPPVPARTPERAKGGRGSRGGSGSKTKGGITINPQVSASPHSSALSLSFSLTPPSLSSQPSPFHQSSPSLPLLSSPLFPGRVCAARHRAAALYAGEPARGRRLGGLRPGHAGVAHNLRERQGNQARCQGVDGL
jgi:hypothetical protein